jgi:hypothetical protein
VQQAPQERVAVPLPVPPVPGEPPEQVLQSGELQRAEPEVPVVLALPVEAAVPVERRLPEAAQEPQAAA